MPMTRVANVLGRESAKYKLTLKERLLLLLLLSLLFTVICSDVHVYML